jgi:hypothetical protein
MTLHYDDKGKFYTEYVSKNAVNAVIQTSTHRITGKIFIRVGERVSDELNESDKFLAVTDASIFDSEGEISYKCDFITVNRDHIVWIMPGEATHPGDEGTGESGSE